MPLFLMENDSGSEPIPNQDPFADPSAGPAQLANRLRKVQKERHKWAKTCGATCWRVYEKDLPDQPMIVDWYDGEAVMWLMSRTRDDTEALAEAWEASAILAVGRGLGLEPGKIHVKHRRRQRDRQGGGQYQRTDYTGNERMVREGDLRFLVNVHDYLDTGLFLDHRPLRAKVCKEAGGKRVLNLFAYTGSFTVAARVGGAAGTTTVDLSNTYVAWAERNLAANGLGLDERHELVKADCLSWLTSVAKSRAGSFDIIVCDPPAFSNSTSMHRSFAVDRDHGALLAACRRLLAPRGTLWFSCNLRGFTLSQPPPSLTIREVSDWTVPEDFRNRQIHRTWQMLDQGEV